MKKKIIIITSSIILSLTLLIGGWIAWTNVNESDFTVEILTDDKNVTIGDTINLTARITNNSGRPLRLRHGDPLVAISITNITPEGDRVNIRSATRTLGINHTFIRNNRSVDFNHAISSNYLGQYEITANASFTAGPHQNVFVRSLTMKVVEISPIISVSSFSYDADVHIIGRDRNLHAGMMIGRGLIPSPGGTMLGMATCNETGRRGIVTNQHVAPLGTIVSHPSGDRIGTTSRAVLTYSGDIATMDAAFVPLANESHWDFNSSARYSTAQNLHLPLEISPQTICPTYWHSQSRISNILLNTHMK